MERDQPSRVQLLTPEAALDALISLLEDQAQWETFAAETDALLIQMLDSRKEAEELGKLYDLRPLPKPEGSAEEAGDMQPVEGNSLPDEAAVKLLRREVLLSTAKLHVMEYERVLGERQLRSIKAQIRQVGQAGYPDDISLTQSLLSVCTAQCAHQSLRNSILVLGLSGTDKPSLLQSTREQENHRIIRIRSPSAASKRLATKGPPPSLDLLLELGCCAPAYLWLTWCYVAAVLLFLVYYDYIS